MQLINCPLSTYELLEPEPPYWFTYELATVTRPACAQAKRSLMKLSKVAPAFDQLMGGGLGAGGGAAQLINIDAVHKDRSMNRIIKSI